MDSSSTTTLAATAPRRTEQRQAIELALKRSARPLTAQQLHSSLIDSGHKVGLATVYRNLRRLADEGGADTIGAESGEQAFMWCGAGHHHHLACRVCGRVEEIRDCGALQEWTRRVAGQHRFTAVEHRAELVGVCRDCSR